MSELKNHVSVTFSAPLPDAIAPLPVLVLLLAVESAASVPEVSVSIGVSDGFSVSELVTVPSPSLPVSFFLLIPLSRLW